MPRKTCLTFAAAGLLLAVPLAQAAPVVVNSLITLFNSGSVANANIYSLAASNTLTVTSTGEIVAPPISSGAAIYLGGNVLNEGKLRAAWGSETQGLWMWGNNNVNASGGLIEAHNFNLGTGSTGLAILTNRGRLETGRFTLPDGRPLTAVTFPGPGVNIANRSQLRNVRDSFSVVGRWLANSEVQVQGLLANDGQFRLSRNPITAPANPLNYTPTLTVFQTYGDTQQATVYNSFYGWMDFTDGTVLRNGGLVANEGVIEIAHGARVENSPAASVFVPAGLVAGRFENRIGGEVLVGSRVNTGTSGYARFINQGDLLNASGLIKIRDGGLFEDRGYFNNQGFLSRFEVDVGGTAGFYGSTENSGVMTVRGLAFVVSNGRLSNTGAVSVEPGGLLNVNNLGAVMSTESGGRTSIAGSLIVNGAFYLSGNGNTVNPQAPELDVLAGGDVSVGGQLVVGSAGSLRNAGTIYVNPYGTLQGEYGARIENRGEVNVQAGGTLRLEGGWNESFENKAGGTLLVSGLFSGGVQTGLVNEGRMVVHTGASVSVPDIQQLDGQLTIEANATLATPGGRLRMWGGQLGGNGRINGDVFAQGTRPLSAAEPECWRAQSPGIACFTPGSSPGHMDITGDLTLGEGAVLELEIERDGAGVLHWDTVNAGSMSFLQGSMIRVLIGDNAAGVGIDNLHLLSCLTGPCSFSATSFEVRGGFGGNFVFGDDGSLSFALAPDVAAVPEPGSYALLLAGLGVVGFVTRRRSSGR